MHSLFTSVAGEFVWLSQLQLTNECSYLDVSFSRTVSSESAINVYIRFSIRFHWIYWISGGVLRYVIECQGPGLPVASVHSWQNHTLVVPLFSTRPSLAEKLSKLALPKRETVHVPLPHGMGKATAQLLLPPSWREELRDAAFPVLIEVLV